MTFHHRDDGLEPEHRLHVRVVRIVSLARALGGPGLRIFADEIAQSIMAKAPFCGTTNFSKVPAAWTRATSHCGRSRSAICLQVQIVRSSRGWNNVRLLSAGSNTFKYDLGSEA
jgi:hypothetical protein